MSEDFKPGPVPEVTPASGAGTAPRSISSNSVFVVEALVDHPNVTKGCRRAGGQLADVGRIVEAAVRAFAQRLGKTVIDGNGTHRRETTLEPHELVIICQRVVCFKSRIVNVHPDDEALLGREEASLASLARLRNVEVIAVPIDFRGHHYRAGRRLASPSRSERVFQPVEKGVDVALASHLVQRCLAPDRPDGVLLMSGDADFLPAIQQVVRLEPPVVVMVAAFKHSLSSVYRDTAVTGHPPIILDEVLAALCANQRPPFGKGGLTMIAPQPRKTAGQRSGNGNGRPDPCADLALGRVAVARPHFGRLDVYIKAGGVLGARFFSETSAGKYGTTLGVRQRFSQPGTYEGWAFLDPIRCVVFRFVQGQRDNAQAPLVSVETPDGHVALPRGCVGSEGLAQGEPVAFYVGLPKYRRNAKPLQRVSHVFPLNEKRPLLLAQLIAGGRLVFPQHGDLMEKFLQALPDVDDVLASQDAEVVRAALNRLANDPGVPGNIQMLARAERARLGSGGPETSTPTAPQASPAPTPGDKTGGKTRRAGKRGGYNPAAGDVSSLDLQLD